MEGRTGLLAARNDFFFLFYLRVVVVVVVGWPARYKYLYAPAWLCVCAWLRGRARMFSLAERNYASGSTCRRRRPSLSVSPTTTTLKIRFLLSGFDIYLDWLISPLLVGPRIGLRTHTGKKGWII